MLYGGIDLAWKEENPSGLALINESKRIIHCSCSAYSDGELTDFISKLSEPAVISVDSPLQVKNEEGGRPCDSELMRHRFNGKTLKVFATSRSYMDRHYGGVRGENLLSLLEEKNNLRLGVDVAETFPSGMVLSLFPHLWKKKYKLSSRLPLDKLKENYVSLADALRERGFHGEFPDSSHIVTKREYKDLEDRIDGILCAVNSYYFSNLKSFVQFGNGSNGLTVIALP